jgi:pimeloyl-ACP methyl ester carboxylesterase
MATFALIHGAGSDRWYWHRVEPILHEAGHETVAVDLPCDDDAAGLTDYADVVVDALIGHADVIVVAQSMAGFVAPLVADRVPSTRMIVLVAAMVPSPGETGDDWWANTGSGEARRLQAERDGRDPGGAFDPVAEFLHDVDPSIAEEAWAHSKEQSNTPFRAAWPLPSWPDVPTRFVLGAQDRFFPPDFQRRVVQERLGIEPDEIDTGHLPALAQPDELATMLLRYEQETRR